MAEAAPVHVLIIPDGNRRYAKQRQVSLESVYRHSAEVVVPKLIRFFLLEGRARLLTIYAVSHDNVAGRDGAEVDPILRSQVAAYEAWSRSAEYAAAGVRFRFVGERAALPEYYRTACRELEEETTGRRGPTCTILAAYDCERELARAAQRLQTAASGAAGGIRSFLDIAEPVDLVIRTGQEKRLSGAPPLPCAYAELFFPTEFFPELDAPQLEAIWAEFGSRNRRFGH
jgi:undecaprenyl diphosphate synthase